MGVIAGTVHSNHRMAPDTKKTEFEVTPRPSGDVEVDGGNLR